LTALKCAATATVARRKGAYRPCTNSGEKNETFSPYLPFFFLVFVVLHFVVVFVVVRELSAVMMMMLA